VIFPGKPIFSLHPAEIRLFLATWAAGLIFFLVMLG
jgi:hypothetical protein